MSVGARYAPHSFGRLLSLFCSAGFHARTQSASFAVTSPYPSCKAVRLPAASASALASLACNAATSRCRSRKKESSLRELKIIESGEVSLPCAAASASLSADCTRSLAAFDPLLLLTATKARTAAFEKSSVSIPFCFSVCLSVCLAECFGAAALVCALAAIVTENRVISNRRSFGFTRIPLFHL